MRTQIEPAASAVSSQPSRSTSAQAQPRVSFSESLQNKLPVGSRFAIAGPAASAAATIDDASSVATQEAPKSAASTMRATPSGPEITAEEDPRMASLHVKFSASTRFNASDAKSMLAAAGIARPSGVIRSGTMRPRPGSANVGTSAGLTGQRRGSLRRLPSGQGSAQSDQEQGPWSGLRRALTGRHRRSASADSGGSYRRSGSGGRLSASSRSSNGTRRSTSSPSQQSSPTSSPAQSSHDDLAWPTLRGGRQGRRRRGRGRGRLGDRGRSSLTGYSSSDGGGQRDGRSGPRRPGVIRSLFSAAFSGPGPGSRRPRSAPAEGGGRGRARSPLGFLRRSRSIASGLEDGSDQGGRPPGGLWRGRSRRRTISESEGEPTRAESRREARRAAALQRRNLSRSRSRGRLSESGDERRDGSPSEGENPLLSFFGLGRRPRPRSRGQSSDSGGDSGRFRSRLHGRSRITSPDGGQSADPRSSRFLPMGSSAQFSGAGPQQGLGGRAMAPDGRMSLAFRTEFSEGEDAGQLEPSPNQQPPPGEVTGRLEARRPPQLDLPPALTRPPTFALRPSVVGGDRGGDGRGRQAPFAGMSSLPALPFVASPAFGTLAGHTASQAPQRYQSQRLGGPQQQQPGGPATGGPPPGASAAPSLRRQKTGGRPPRALSRPRRAESAPRSRAAQRRAERAESGDGGKLRSMSARRHFEADPSAPKSFAAQRRQRKISASGDPSSETSPTAANRLGSFFSRLLGRRPQAGAPTTPSPERPAPSPPVTDITTPVLSPSPTPSLPTPRPSNISAVDSLPSSTPGASHAPGPGTAAPATTAPAAVPSAPAAAPPPPGEAAAAAAPRPAAGPGRPSTAGGPPGTSPARVEQRGQVGGTTPGPSPAGGPTGDLRDSPLMQIPPGPARTAARPRPTPLQIPSDPRASPQAGTRIEAAPRPGQATGAGSAAVAVQSAAVGAAGAPVAAAEATPEKARKGGWSQLGRVFGAMLPSKWLSPSKPAQAQTQEPPPAAASASAMDLVREGAGGLAFSASELPRPAFPVPRPPDAAEGGPAAAGGGDGAAADGQQAPAEAPQAQAKAEGQPPGAAQQEQKREQPGRGGGAEGAGDPLLRESPFMRLAQEAFKEDSTGADSGKTTRTNTRRKGRHGRASSEVPSRLAVAAVAMGPMGLRPATAGSALPELVLRAPANLPIGRSISPLGRSMAAAAAGGGAGVVPPVVMLAPLAAAAQRHAIVSPLRTAHRNVAGAATAATTTTMTIRPDAAPWGVDSQGVLISVDRPAGIDSALHPSPGARALSPPRHLPRPARPHSGLPYTGDLLPPPTDISIAVDASVFPAGVPGPTLEPPAAGYGLPASSQTLRPGTAGPMPSQQAQTQPQQLRLPPQSPTRAAWGREPGPGQEPQVVVEFPAGGPMAVEGQRPAAQVQVQVRSLRTPLALGLRQPGVGLMLSQAPEVVRAVAGAEAAVQAEAMAEAAAAAGAPRGTGLPGVRMAWGETAARVAQPLPAPVLDLPPLTTAGLRLLPQGGLPRGSLLAAQGPAEEAVAERSWRGAADGVMQTAAGPIADLLASSSMAVGRSQFGPVNQLPATAHGRHRPLWLGRRPAEPYPPLQRPDPGPLLGPDMPYTASAAAVPGLSPRTADVLRPRTQPGPAPAFPGGAGGLGGGHDDSSSLVSSTTVDSLRAASPLLATEQRQRGLLLAPAPAGAGVSGITVRTLQREVTAGPHVKLMKPKQLLRGLQPPGPSPAFTRRQPPFVTQEQQARKEEPGESTADEEPHPAGSAQVSDAVAGTDASAVEASGGGDGSGEESRGASTQHSQRSLPLPDERPAVAPGGEPGDTTQADAPEADSEAAAAAAAPSGNLGGGGGFSEGRVGVDARAGEGETGRRGEGGRASPSGVAPPGPSRPLLSPRGTAGPRGEPLLPASMEPPPGPRLWGQATYDDQENAAPGDLSWGRMPASLVRVDRTGVPGVRTLVASPLANRLSPPRLLRVPSAPMDHQPTRRHLNRGFSDVADEPRFLNVRLMRVLGPPAQPSSERPGERPPPQLPMRKLRVLERPEGEMPGIVPAGTAGRTEHLLGMLRQPVERTGRTTAGLGQRVGLFDRTSPPRTAQRDAAESPTRHNAAVQHSPTTHRAAVQHSPEPREALNATTQSGPASPQIDIHVHTVTTATGSSTPIAAAPPPVEPYPYPFYQPPAPPLLAAPVTSSEQPPPPPPLLAYQQQPQPQPSALPMVVAAADPAALAGLSALSQLTALTSLAGLSAAAGAAPGVDDPSLWPDLMETTPEALRQVSENTALRWRLQRPALAQANTAVLRDMEPELQLEPDQVQGPGLPGDAQQTMRGGVLHGGPAGAPLAAHGEPSRSVDGRVLGVGRAAAEARRVQGGERGGGEGLSQREEERRRRRAGKVELEEEWHGGGRRGGGGRGEGKGRKGERRRQDRRRRRRRSSSTSSSTSSSSDSVDGDGSSSSSSESTPSKASSSSSNSSSSESCDKRRRQKKKKKSGAKDKKERHKATSPAGDAAAPGLEPQPRGPGQRPMTRLAAGASRTHPEGGSPQPHRAQPASAPPSQQQPQQQQPWPSQGPAAAAAARPEPGEDFGMDVAERLLRRMTEEQLGRPSSLQRRTTSRASSGTRSQAEARGPPAAPGGTEGAGPLLQGADVEDDDEAGLAEAASPPSGRRFTDGALDRPPADPRDSSSPHAKMVDVLHGPDTERRAQEILARQDALRAKFLAAADNLRAEMAAAGLAASQRTTGVAAAALPAATPPPPLPSALAGAAQLASGQDDLAPEPTLSHMPPQAPSSIAAGPSGGAAAAAVGAGSQAAQAAGASPPGPTAVVAGRAPGQAAFDAAAAAGFQGGSGPAAAVAAPGQLQVGGGPNLAFHPPTHQAINIYCTQLVLNPGRGPITVPGLPAYYPAPGPAAWGGVPMAVPTSPPPYPGQHYADGGYARDLQHQPDRAHYVRSAHTPPRSYPPAVQVSPTGTAAWLPPSRPPGADGATPTQPSPSSSPPKPAAAQGSAPSGATGAGAAAAAAAAPSLSRDTQRSDASVVPSHAAPGRITKVKPAAQVEATPALQVLPPEPSGTSLAVGGSKAADDGERGSEPESVPTSGAGSVDWQGSSVGSDSHEEHGQGLSQGSEVTSSGQASGEGAAGEIATTDSAQPSYLKIATRSAATRAPADGRQSAQGSTVSEAAEREQQLTRPQQQAKLAVELSQLIMEAFQQSGGVIRPADIDTIRPSPGAAADATSGAHQRSSPDNPRVPSQTQQRQPSGPQRPGPQELGAAARPSAAAAGGGGGGSGGGGGGGSSQPPAFLTDAYSGSISDTLPAPDPPPAPAGPLPPPPPRLPSTLPNAAVPRGKGPSFLQVRDIQLAPPPGQAQDPDGQDPARDALADEILGGLNGWEEGQVMAALQGRPPVPQPWEPRPQPGQAGGSQLTAAEALALEPGYTQQYQLEVLRRRRAQREAAVAERRQRYQAGLQHFADPSQPLRPLHLPPPEYQMPLPGDTGRGVVAATAAATTDQDTPTRAPAGSRHRREEGKRAGWNAGGGGGHGEGKSPLWGDATHGSLFPPQPTYLTGPGTEAQPHPRSPLQRRMHGDVRPRKRWSQQRERQPGRSPQAMAMLQHQRTFTSRVRSAMRSPGLGRDSGHATGRPNNPTTRGRAGGVTFADEAFGGSPGYRPAAGAVGGMEGTTGRVPYMARVSPNAAAVRSLAAMVAHRLEGYGRGYGQGDLMRMYDGGVAGHVGGPGVEPYYTAGGGEDGEEEEEEGGSEDWDGEEDELGMETECGGCDFPGCPVHGITARRRDAAAASVSKAAKRARTGGERPQGRADRTPADAADAAVDEKVRQRSQREMHRAVMLDQWMAEMKALNVATARAEATRSLAVASAQQALAARRERQTAELSGIFNLLGEVDALANDMEQQTRDTKKMMQALEEEAELRQVSRLNSLLIEARRLGGQVDAALQPGQAEGQGQGEEAPGGGGAGGAEGGSASPLGT